MPRKVTVTKTDAGKLQALDSTNQPIVEADTPEEVREFFSELPAGEIELTFPEDAKADDKRDAEKSTDVVDPAKKGFELVGEADQGQDDASETSADETGKVVPLAALLAERSKRQTLTTAMSEVGTLRQEIAQLRSAMTKPAEQEAGDDESDNAPVTKKELMTFLGEIEKRQKASQADGVIKEMAALDKPEGFLLDPKQIMDLTAPYLKNDVEARRLLVETEDKVAALHDLERIALMTIALKDPRSFPGLSKSEPAKPAVKPGSTAQSASMAAAKKIDALAAGAKIHDALSQAGEQSGSLTDPIEGHIAKLQSLSADPAGYAAYWSKLPADVRKAVDAKLE